MLSLERRSLSSLPNKVQVIKDYPKPKTVVELRKFLGIINFYRRFVKGAAYTQAPLHSYLIDSKKRTDDPFNGTKRQNGFSRKLKNV